MSYVLQLPRKWAREIGISAKPHVNEALPAVTMRINGFRRLALLDTGCSRLLVTRALCHSWEKKKVGVFTEGALRCCGVGCVQLDVGSGCPIDAEVLVTDGKLLGFNLLLGFHIIKKLGGVYMTRDGTMSFPPLDITIDKPDFHAEFDQNKKIWVESWKWSENQTPPKLENKATENLVPKPLRAEFDNEFWTWIDKEGGNGHHPLWEPAFFNLDRQWL